MSTWRIYYDDGSTFSHTDGHPEQAPTDGFAVAVGVDAAGARYQMMGWDFYRFDTKTGQWWGHNIHGILSRLRSNLEVRALKEGRTMDTEAYQRLCNTARHDPDFAG